MLIKEIESKLFLDNKFSVDGFKEIKNVDCMNGFTLKNEKHFSIDDIYFDTHNLILNKNNSYLRFRNKNEESQITLRLLKQETKTEFVIDELTHSLNLIGMRLVLQKLREERILNAIDLSVPDFGVLMEKSGLIEVLSIHNDRIEKEIWIDDLTIGKMKFDYFYYKSLPHIKFAEIETDIYNKIFIEGIKKLKNILRDKFNLPAIENNISKYRRGINNKLFC